MKNSDPLIDGNRDIEGLEDILESSLQDKDFFSQSSMRRLSDLGVGRKEALAQLAAYKSRVKYGYELSFETISHLLLLSGKPEAQPGLHALIRSPYFLAKACWIYEHAPYFLFTDTVQVSTLDALILAFAQQYEQDFFNSSVPIHAWKPLNNPLRVCGTTFWEADTLDPLRLLVQAHRRNLEGMELAVDFHPFNIFKLLPEDFTPEKRAQIKSACQQSGFKLDIHSPIVGPYSPSPDPAIGRQCFYDPLNYLDLQFEVVELASDMGAGAVVFHLIDNGKLQEMAALVERAAGTAVLVTIENYCQTELKQTADEFIACVDAVFRQLTGEVKRHNFGITIDVGHLNIEGEDPLLAASKIGHWCQDNRVPFRLHATDNYGDLLYHPPAFSADVHSNVSGRGINNEAIIKMLRSMGHAFDVVAEQIQPLTGEDIAYIHAAQTSKIEKSYPEIVADGRTELSAVESGRLINAAILEKEAYQFLAGLEGVSYLREYLLYRKIQNKKNLSVDEAKEISGDIMKMPQKFRKDIITYIDDLLLPVQSESGALQKIEKDVLFHNISGALFTAISNEHLDQIFSDERAYRQDEVICAQDTYGHEMYYLKEGAVSVHIGDNVAVLEPGEIFGEMSLFYNTTRIATIKVTSRTATVGILTRKGLERLFRSCQPYALDLAYRLYNILPQRVRNINEKYRSALNKLGLLVRHDANRSADTDIQLREIVIHETPSFFPTLSLEDARSIYSDTLEFEADRCIFSEGDPATGAYYVVAGSVKVVGSSPEGVDILFGKLGPGEIFGEMALIDNQPRAASVITLTPCTLGFISSQTFGPFIEERSDLAFRLINFICLSLFNHIRRIDKSYSDIRERLNPA